MSQRMRPFAVLTLALLLPTAFLGAHADGAEVESEGAGVPTTYWLHGKAGTADQVGEVVAAPVGAAATVGPTMDANEPTSPVPKALRTAAGNQDYRKNVLLGYWSGAVQGHVSDLTARLWISTHPTATVTVTLFGDGGIGSATPIARATASAPGGGSPKAIDFTFTGVSAMIKSEMVLSVHGGSAGVTLLYDAVSAPSALSFTLGPYVPQPVLLPRTPAPGWGPVHTISLTEAQREASLAISPVDESLMILCAPSSAPNMEYGQSYFHVSRDGGETWGYLQVETDAADTRRYAFEGADCDVAFDDAGTMYSADTWLGSLSVGSSADGGKTWYGTSIANNAPVVDRPWLVGGPAGTVHLTWQDVQSSMPSAIWYARSTDYGLTFTPPVSVATANDQGGFTWTGNLVVSPDAQHLYSIYTRRLGPAAGSLDNSGPETVWIASSHDGGVNWTSSLIASMPNPASYLYPSLGMDKAGGLHAVWASRTATDRPIWYSYSADGAAWTEPAKLLAGVAGFSPWVVGGEAGQARIQWYGYPDGAGATTARQDWYFYWAKVENAATPEQSITAGTTTTVPIFKGVSAIPEFNQVRLDSGGRMHVAAAAYYAGNPTNAPWALFHQREL